MLSGWDRVNWCRTNEQNKRVSSELVVGAARHCPHKKEHRLTVQTCGRGVSVSGVVGSAVADPYSGFIHWVCVRRCAKSFICIISLAPLDDCTRWYHQCHSEPPSALNRVISPSSSCGPRLRDQVLGLWILVIMGFCSLRACFIECHPNTWEGEESPVQECLALVRVSSSQGRCVTLGTQEPWGSR